MKTPLLVTLFIVVIATAHGGDWGKSPVGKSPIVEECVDLGGEIGIGYQTDYIYRGLVAGGDTVVGSVNYTFAGLPLPITFGARYANVVATNKFANVFNDELTLSARVGLPTVAGIESSVSFSERFYPEDPDTAVWPSSHGEFGLHLSKDLNLAVVNFDAYYNSRLPNAWNGTIPTLANQENGAWYWELGLERQFDLFGQGFVVGGGVGYADNYWGVAPNAQSGGDSSGWNHYFLSASVPIELNCRTVLTPYLGYLGSPEGWLMDGAPDWAGRSAQSEMLHGGVNLSVSF